MSFFSRTLAETLTSGRLFPKSLSMLCPRNIFVASSARRTPGQRRMIQQTQFWDVCKWMDAFSIKRLSTSAKLMSFKNNELNTYLMKSNVSGSAITKKICMSALTYHRCWRHCKILKRFRKYRVLFIYCFAHPDTICGCFISAEGINCKPQWKCTSNMRAFRRSPFIIESFTEKNTRYIKQPDCNNIT